MLFRSVAVATTPKASGVNNLARIILEIGVTSFAATSVTTDHFAAFPIVLLFNSSIHILHRMLNSLFIKTSCEQSCYSTVSHPSQNTHFPAFDVA